MASSARSKKRKHPNTIKKHPNPVIPMPSFVTSDGAIAMVRSVWCDGVEDPVPAQFRPQGEGVSIVYSSRSLSLRIS